MNLKRRNYIIFFASFISLLLILFNDFCNLSASDSVEVIGYNDVAEGSEINESINKRVQEMDDDELWAFIVEYVDYSFQSDEEKRFAIKFLKKNIDYYEDVGDVVCFYGRADYCGIALSIKNALDRYYGINDWNHG